MSLRLLCLLLFLLRWRPASCLLSLDSPTNQFSALPPQRYPLQALLIWWLLIRFLNIYLVEYRVQYMYNTINIPVFARLVSLSQSCLHNLNHDNFRWYSDGGGPRRTRNRARRTRWAGFWTRGPEWPLHERSTSALPCCVPLADPQWARASGRSARIEALPVHTLEIFR